MKHETDLYVILQKDNNCFIKQKKYNHPNKKKTNKK